MMAKNKILAKASKEKECHWLNSKSDNGHIVGAVEKSVVCFVRVPFRLAL